VLDTELVYVVANSVASQHLATFLIHGTHPSESYIVVLINKMKTAQQLIARGWKGLCWPYWHNSCRVLPTCCETPTWGLCTTNHGKWLSHFCPCHFSLVSMHSALAYATVGVPVVCSNFGLVIWLVFIPHTSWEY